ncbi:MAG: DinB family protein [Gemmatimonadaceae bacterium]
MNSTFTFATGEPFHASELTDSLLSIHTDLSAYLDSLAPTTFFARIGDAWSPAENARHLIKSMRPIVLAMKAPRIVLAVLFGISVRPSRDFARIRAAYREQLALGGKAGRFAPSLEGQPAAPLARRKEIMTALHDVLNDLVLAAQPWSERALDRYRLPHPLLGKLTVREMLMFTVYHNSHHAINLRTRLS